MNSKRRRASRIGFSEKGNFLQIGELGILVVKVSGIFINAELTPVFTGYGEKQIGKYAAGDIKFLPSVRYKDN